MVDDNQATENVNKGLDINFNIEYPLLPLRDTVIFPGVIAPLFVGRTKSVNAIDEAFSSNKYVVLSAQKDSKENDPQPDKIYDVATLTKIVQVMRLADGSIKTLAEGIARVRIRGYTATGDRFKVNIDRFDTEREKDTDLEAFSRSLKSQLRDIATISEMVSDDLLIAINEEVDPEKVCDMMAANFIMLVKDKQAILSEPDLKKRLEKMVELMQHEVEISRVEKSVKSRIKAQVEKTQRNYYLHEQMKAIQKELDREDGSVEKSEFDEIRDAIKAANMPKDVMQKALKELDRLSKMPQMSAESTVSRNYIDWLINVPWKKRTKDKLDIEKAGQILDEDHYGLGKIKDRILEYLAVRKLVNKIKGPLLCFVGPPGVGKTSLGQSIARAMGRKFARFSLGGLRDEAEIRGHRRTYVGALPGRIVQVMKKVGVKNPLIMLDEIDKIGTDFRGDPSSALLEVLDPEQNTAFNDHYLEVDYDLSEVMFVTTANTLSTIPRPLMDRMEVIDISGYSDDEKLNIAKRFLVPKKVKEHGITDVALNFSDDSILEIIRGYTRESGVRELERQIGAICRKVAKEVATNKKGKGKLGSKDSVLNKSKVVAYLGEEKYGFDGIETTDPVGVAVGLAWSSVGGSLLKIEVSVVEGKGEFIMTGTLGDVMKESAQAALTYIRSRREKFSLPKGFHEKIDIHLHIPEGAVPKDGPSAGMALAIAMLSAFTKKAVKGNFAMTGEMTLRGRVLPIGGLKEKLLAAVRGNIDTVFIPKRNRREFMELPSELKSSIKIVEVSNVDEVISKIFIEPDKPKKSARGSRSDLSSVSSTVN